MKERRVIIFSGTVQGVGFRATTRGIMRGFAVTGWVRNEPDGTVRLEVQGDAAEIEAGLAALRNVMGGHIQSEVAGSLPAEVDEIGFEISRDFSGRGRA